MTNGTDDTGAIFVPHPPLAEEPLIVRQEVTSKYVSTAGSVARAHASPRSPRLTTPRARGYTARRACGHARTQPLTSSPTACITHGMHCLMCRRLRARASRKETNSTSRCMPSRAPSSTAAGPPTALSSTNSWLGSRRCERKPKGCARGPHRSVTGMTTAAAIFVSIASLLLPRRAVRAAPAPVLRGDTF